MRKKRKDWIFSGREGEKIGKTWLLGLFWSFLPFQRPLTQEEVPFVMDFEEGTGFQQPTYELEPRPGEKFLPHEVRKVVKNIMDKKLKDAEYDDEKCKQMSLDLCKTIKDQVKGRNVFPCKCFFRSLEIQAGQPFEFSPVPRFTDVTLPAQSFQA
jgi:hypothetical protein